MEEFLQKQRDVHNKLINVGMEKISLSYLKPFEDTFRAADVNFRAVVKEGKNFGTVNGILAEEGKEEGDVCCYRLIGLQQQWQWFYRKRVFEGFKE